jgi:hypothetical protein
LNELTTCGWLLSILRLPEGTGKLLKRVYLNPAYIPTISIDRNCTILHTNGLDGTLYDLLTLRHGSLSTEILLQYLGNLTPGAKIRANMQLEYLYHKFQKHFEELWPSRLNNIKTTCES